MVRKYPPKANQMWSRVTAPDFILEASMDCGQIFGWQKRGATYLGMIGGSAVSLCQEGETVVFAAEPALTPEEVVAYLGLDVDLPAVLRAVARDAFMRQVVRSVRGLRLLRQEPWPCLCSYIISANNRVERIDKLVKELSMRLGKRHLVHGTPVYSQPSPGDLVKCAESGLRSCGVGFRAPYLIKAAGMVADGAIDFDAMAAMSCEEAREVLKTIPGVGDKIADCVLLFAFSRYETFPVDVWIKRTMEKVYFNSRDVRPAEIRRFGQRYFGRFAGYAQEYIYYYARNHGLT